VVGVCTTQWLCTVCAVVGVTMHTFRRPCSCRVFSLVSAVFTSSSHPCSCCCRLCCRRTGGIMLHRQRRSLSWVRPCTGGGYTGGCRVPRLSAAACPLVQEMFVLPEQPQVQLGRLQHGVTPAQVGGSHKGCTGVLGGNHTQWCHDYGCFWFVHVCDRYVTTRSPEHSRSQPVVMTKQCPNTPDRGPAT
jgi:hypothetical protein